MTEQIERLRDQLARAVARGDRVAEINLRNRIRAALMRSLPEMSELEMRFAFGDR